MINVAPLKASIYRVNTPTGTGTAFFLKDPGLIITAASAVEDYATVELLTTQYRNITQYKNVYCKVLFTDSLQNIALLSLMEYLELVPLPLADDKEVKEGDEIVAIGYEGFEESCSTTGNIIRLQASYQSIPMISVSAEVHYNNIGGPLITASGHVAGVNVYTPEDNPDQGLALPLSVLRETLELYAPVKGSVATRCTDCRSLLLADEVDNYDDCPHCGNPVIYPEEVMETDVSKLSVYEKIGSVLRGMWIDDNSTKNGLDNWDVPFGSAMTFISYDSAGTGHIYAKSYLGLLPEDAEKAATVYQFLLEENEHRTTSVFICQSNRIYLSNTRHQDDFHYDYVLEAYPALFNDADKFKTLLREKFGCTG